MTLNNEVEGTKMTWTWGIRWLDGIEFLPGYANCRLRENVTGVDLNGVQMELEKVIEGELRTR